jgi:hypothetical protein
MGLAIPALLLIYWKIGGSVQTLASFLWPSSILLMGLEGPGTRSIWEIGQVYAILITENVVLYLIVGLLTSPLLFFLARKRNRSTLD